MEISNQVIKIKTGFENMDIIGVHQFLSKESYWAKGIPPETVSVALKNSFCIGLFKDEKQIGFARLVTDYATFGYLADVYVLKEYRGKGLSKMMMKYIMELDFVQRLRRTLLATLDAHSLYRQFGFQSPENPERLMEIKRNNLYKDV
ncbi:GNAT family N-acetyltransferase [Allomuricauda taeanensis]|uniref:GNAT family N-acetyltransferase n=1 Tax=Flagellimonas taeanensis TaxID=1005926 RepID=UPI002E7B6BB1|nr:GNAT family N-acetyltransferase [Allomuricauda taeanensis]MEE1963894.1 GNAT family N-acetyltransferase [Allomuricauda taeanensis]